MCQHLGIETDDEIIPRIAAGFGGGIGNTGAVCGAVIGGVMGLGLGMKQGESMEDMMAALTTAGEFSRRFEARMGSVHCGELTGADLTTPAGVAEYMSSDTPLTVCFPAVNTAYDLVREMLDETQ